MLEALYMSMHVVQVSRAQLVEEDATHKANHVGNKRRRLRVTLLLMLVPAQSIVAIGTNRQHMQITCQLTCLSFAFHAQGAGGWTNADPVI